MHVCFEELIYMLSAEKQYTFILHGMFAADNKCIVMLLVLEQTNASMNIATCIFTMTVYYCSIHTDEFMDTAFVCDRVCLSK